MSWFEDWFDSPLYEKMYTKRDEEEAAKLADLLAELLPVEMYKSVLDLGCGRGRHSINFAKRGYTVTGIDLSEKAIQKARKKAEELHLDIEFLIGDMRHPLDRTFDGIINLFTSFGYFADDEENVSVIKAMKSMLRKDGFLVIDYLNAGKVKDDLIPYEEGKIDGVSYDICRYLEEDTVNKKMQFHTGSSEAKKEYTERVKLYDLNWFQTHLEEEHIKIEKVFGDYDGSPFNKQESPRLLIIGKLAE
ncbi:MAG TPA: class I SAM-dependent methyltransferase [Balneolales bacterium]|nr:class I SAM-dependent methyltransferase [Balneolales bacterium]